MTTEGKSRTWLWVLLGGGAFFLFLVAVFSIVYMAARSDQRSDFSGFGDKIAVVDLEGVILDPKAVVKNLKRYADDDSVKAIILHVNTPGGGAAASQEIYAEVRRIRDVKKKLIVADIETLGASGGYYVSSGASKIYANPASIVGSIGVISQWFNYGELIRWAKLKDVTFKAGALKDTGNPAREMTEEEKKYFQSILDDMHQQFIHDVADGRKLKEEDVKAIADGRVWTGAQALPLKLVDKLGDFEFAVQETAREAGIKGEPVLVRPEKYRRSLWDALFDDASDLFPDKGTMLESHPGFYYLWK